MKYVKSLVVLAFAAFLCASASASLIVDGDDNNKIRTATRAVVVGETVTVPLYNSKNETYASPSAAELTAGDGGTNATSQAYFSVEVPTNVNQNPQNVVIRGLQATPEPMTFKIWKDAAHRDTPVEITVKVVAPIVSYVGTVKVTSVGAATNVMENGDLLLTFTETGSFSLDGDVQMRRVLLVGGGAAGNNARNTGDYIYGRSGSGAQAYTNSTLIGMPAGDYDVTVGAGALLSYKYEGNEWVEKSSGGVASMITNTTNNGFATLTAEGGKSAQGWSGTAGIDGEGGTNMWCDITGIMTLYGTDAPAASSSFYGIAGDANTGAGGVGGYNGDGVSGGGAGGSGIVVIRLLNPEPVSVEVIQPLTYNGLIQTGVVENAGYTLTGTSVATNATTYSVTATLKSGYCWENGSKEAATNITWSIARAPVTVSAVDCEKFYGSADPEPLPATIVGTNGFDGAVIKYDITRDVGEMVGTYPINLVSAPEEQGNYLVSVVQPTTETFTINWANPYPLVLEGGAVTVKVEKAWLVRNFFSEEALDPDQLSTALQRKCNADDFLMWQKYLINVNTNNGIAVAAPENFDPDTVSILPSPGTPDYNQVMPVAEAVSGFKVRFRLDEGLGEDRRVVVPEQDDMTLKVSLAGNPNSSNYLAYVVFKQNDYKYEQPFRNYIGILRSEPCTTSGGAREFVAVPWNRYDGAANGLPPTNIVKTALLSEGDKLYYLNKKDRFEYDAWELDANKIWQPINAIGRGPNGCWSNQVNKITKNTTVKLGGALWLDRKDATTGVVFVGGGRTRGTPAVTTNTYVYACSPLGLTELDGRTLDCRKGARVIIPTLGAPIIWTHNGKKWTSEVQEVNKDTGIVETRKLDDEKDFVIKPGRGYWLDRTAEVPPEN